MKLIFQIAAGVLLAWMVEKALEAAAAGYTLHQAATALEQVNKQIRPPEPPRSVVYLPAPPGAPVAQPPPADQRPCEITDSKGVKHFCSGPLTNSR